MKTLDELRQRIDALDERLVELLNERASCAMQIGDIKQRLGMEVYQPERESQVLGHVRAHGAALGGPLGGGRIDETVRTDHRRGTPARTRVGVGA